MGGWGSEGRLPGKSLSDLNAARSPADSFYYNVKIAKCAFVQIVNKMYLSRLQNCPGSWMPAPLQWEEEIPF